MRQFLVGLTLSISLAACLGDAVGPAGSLVVERVGPSDSIFIGAPGRALAEPVVFRVRDRDGHPLARASVSWRVLTGGGRLERAEAATGLDGTVRAGWVLGTA